MMAKNYCSGLINSLGNHINPQKDEKLKKTKTEVDEKAEKLTRLIRARNNRKKIGGANIPLSDIISLVEDFHKEYLSLYALHEDLLEEMRDKINDNEIEEEGSFTTYNAEDSFFSADEMSRGSSPAYHSRRVSADFGLKPEIPSAQILDLKSKLASMTEKEALNSEYKESLRKIEASEKIIEDLKTEAAESLSKIQEYEKVIGELKIEAYEKESVKEKLLDELSLLKEKYAENETKLVYLREEHEAHVSKATTREKNLETEISSLKHEGKNLCNEKRDLQGKVEGKFHEAKQLGEENLKLKACIEELEKMTTEKEKQLSSLEQILEENQSNSISKIQKVNQELSVFRNQGVGLREIVDNTKIELRKTIEVKEKFERQVKDLKQKVDFMISEKNQVEMQMEKKSKEAEQLRVDNEELHDRISQLEKLELKQGAELSSIQKVSEGLENNSSVKIKSSEDEGKKIQEKMKLNLKIIERKIEETAEGFCKKIEDNIRILSRRIIVAEQLHMDNKDIYIKTKEKYEKDHNDYTHIHEITEAAVKSMRDTSFTASVILDKSEKKAIKFNEQSENFLNRISKASCEVLFAKDWVRRKNEAIKSLREDTDSLLLEMGNKESEILGLRERVWKSENKVRELEKLVKEKEDGMLSVGEEKREAIRQLCVWIEYHRSRSDSLKKVLSDLTAARRQRITGKK